jgi:DNA-binding NarL/FixJ family response regulator
VLHCLIVDDNPHFTASARRLLERQGISVTGVAATGEEALRRADELRPDVMLVDIDLGGESGLELAGRLNHQEDRGTRIILISSHAEADSRDLIAASPAVGFRPKDTLSARAIHDLLAGSAGEAPG